MRLASAAETTAYGRWHFIELLQSESCLLGWPRRSECGSDPKGFRSAEEDVLASKILNQLDSASHTFWSGSVKKNDYGWHPHLTCR